MSEQAIRKIVIVGGGTAGWMTAAPLAQRLGARCEIVLVESPEIGTVGVGEATLPTIRYYNQALGLDATDFVKKTQATFKLGTEFRDWGHVGNRFFHAFGNFGPPIENRPAYMYWLRLARDNPAMPPYEEWSTAGAMARADRFVPPYGDQPAVTNSYSYGFQFDATLYAAYLRDYALARGVGRLEGTVVDVEQHPETGFVAAVRLRDGRRVDGDLFIDCTGFRALLLEGVYRSGYEDWSALLPCNSALALPCASPDGPLTPYTRSTARGAGWTWRIPLQHRIGNGYVYCDGFTTDDEAARVLHGALEGDALGEPRRLRFTPGRRRKAWIKNCVGVGLSTGFIEPLESTSINMIEQTVGWLVQFFPDRACRPELAEEFNRLVSQRFEYVRDFIILHYKLTQRDDSEFWRYCRNMPIPDILRHQIDLFRASSRVAILDQQGFLEDSWASILLGHGIVPERNDPFIDLMDGARLAEHFRKIRASIRQAVAGMPDHAAFVRQVAGVPLPARLIAKSAS